MANLVGKVVTKKILTKEFAPPDPYYETYPDDEGKPKHRKRALPTGLSQQDAAILRSVQKRAHRLDAGFHICGLEFGWSFFIGIIPVVGTAVNLGLNHTFVVKKAKKAEIPASLLGDMKMHNLISTGMGMVPAVGDICVAVYKPNSRNATILEDFLKIRGEEALRFSSQVDGRSSSLALDGQTGTQRLKREHKDPDQVNLAAAPGTKTPSVTDTAGPST